MRRGTISILENQFETDEIFIIHNISPNPSIEEIDEITKIYKKKGIKNIIALGGISKSNLKILRLINCYGFGGISYFE